MAKRKTWSIVFAVSLTVLIVCVVALGVIGFSYFQGQQKYREIADNAQISEQGESVHAHIDWDALLRLNPETVAWVYMPDTAIDYPVVHGSDNEYYLTHDFTDAEGWLATYGAIFMDYRNNPDLTDALYFIYGHHMNDGSMFADLAVMTDQGAFDAHRSVYLFTPSGALKLRTFSVVHCAADEAIVQTSFADEQGKTAYIQDVMDRSVVSSGDTPPAASLSTVFAFATCDNVSDGRYVVYAYCEEAEGAIAQVVKPVAPGMPAQEAPERG